MNDWSGLRSAAVIVVWVAIALGVVLAGIWFSSGGLGAVGPEDDDLARNSGIAATSRNGRVSSFSSAQIGLHGLLGVLTGVLVSYGANLRDDRTDGYVALLVALAITAAPGLMMFRKWWTKQRPEVAGSTNTRPPQRVEDRLPLVLVAMHGLLVVATVAIVVVLLTVD